MFHGILLHRIRSMENTSFQMTITHFVSIITPPNGSKKFQNFTQRISTHLNVWYSNFQHMVEKVNVVVYQFENTSFQMTITHFVSIITPPNGSKKFQNFTQRISTHLNVWYSNFQHMVEKVNVVVYQFQS
jgi:ABC-type long-subunit fatty acid transport system fused permease/ATPase subunit